MTSSTISSRLLFVVALLFAPTITVSAGEHQLRLVNPNGGAQRTSTRSRSSSGSSSSRRNVNEGQAGSQEMLEMLQKRPLVNDLASVYKNTKSVESFSTSTETGGTNGIPKDFLLNDMYLLSNDESKYQPFPRWHHRTNEDEFTMIEALLDFINATSVSYNTSNSNKYAKLTDHKDDKLGNTPEVFYVLHHGGVYISQSGFDALTIFDKPFPMSLKPLQKKTNAIHSLMKRSYDKLLSDTMTSSLKWPRLFHLLVNEKRDVPFFIWYGDYTGCNLHNWREKQSVPLFTMAGNIDCQYTFPIPTYETYLDSVESEQAQSRNNNNAQATIEVSIWKAKNATVMWRGSLTGQKYPTSSEDIESARGIRYQLLKLIHSDKLSEQQKRLFDVKATSLGGDLELDESMWPTLGYRGRGVGERRSGKQQDRYRAILDVDGHSWSARFGNLLGKQSVVLKIEPQEVDYFHFKRSKADASKRLLEPWKHYIPVKRDLSDLIEKVKYALSDNNADHIVQIISNANEWHRTNMVKDVMACDLLDIWESYVTILDKYSHNWIDQWERNQQTIMTDASLNMSLLQEFI